MLQKTAVVFDNSGTLLHMFRVAKELKTGICLKNIETTELVAEKEGRALIVMNIDPHAVKNTDSSKLLHQFIKENNLKIAISCSNKIITYSEAEAIINMNNVKITDIKEVISCTEIHCPKNYYNATGFIVDKETQSIPYVLSSTGKLYTNSKKVIDYLHLHNTDTYIASGDTLRVLRNIAYRLEIPLKNVFDMATTEQKAKIIMSLKCLYEKVIMVGDGMNDIMAFKAADIAILTLQQGNVKSEKVRKHADFIINNICDVAKIVKTIQNMRKF